MTVVMQNPPINLESWIAANKTQLAPPIGNFQFWKSNWQNFIVSDGWRAKQPSRLS